MIWTFKKVSQAAYLKGKTWKQNLLQALMSYRATPHYTAGISPAEALFNHPITTTLPETDLTPSTIDEQLRLNDNERKTTIKEYAVMKQNAAISKL